MVGAPGFEPGASCAQGRRATRLRYAPTVTSILAYFWKFLAVVPGLRVAVFFRMIVSYFALAAIGVIRVLSGRRLRLA